MTEKHFYDWQTLGGTDDVMRIMTRVGDDKVWSIARNNTGTLFKVTSVQDFLNERITGWSDPERRQSKRLKDLADIARLIESNAELWYQLPAELRSQIDEPRA